MPGGGGDETGDAKEELADVFSVLEREHFADAGDVGGGDDGLGMVRCTDEPDAGGAADHVAEVESVGTRL